MAPSIQSLCPSLGACWLGETPPTHPSPCPASSSVSSALLLLRGVLPAASVRAEVGTVSLYMGIWSLSPSSGKQTAEGAGSCYIQRLHDMTPGQTPECVWAAGTLLCLLLKDPLLPAERTSVLRVVLTLTVKALGMRTGSFPSALRQHHRTPPQALLMTAVWAVEPPCHPKLGKSSSSSDLYPSCYHTADSFLSCPHLINSLRHGSVADRSASCLPFLLTPPPPGPRVSFRVSDLPSA